jgi:hypothetical protein
MSLMLGEASRLGNAAGRTAARRRWAKRFLQQLSPLGYRLSTPPDKLHLHILDKDCAFLPDREAGGNQPVMVKESPA